MAKTNKTNQPSEIIETREVESEETVTETQDEAVQEAPANGPVIEYIGEGAEEVEFTVDPKATTIRVYANGIILTDY
jgi:hypothetical protein